MIRKIKYKNKIIKVIFKRISDYAVYSPQNLTLTIRKGLSNQYLARTLFHELFHIITDLNDFNVSKHGEEKVASLIEEYYYILKQNKNLKNLIISCF